MSKGFGSNDSSDYWLIASVSKCNMSLMMQLAPYILGREDPPPVHILHGGLYGPTSVCKLELVIGLQGCTPPHLFSPLMLVLNLSAGICIWLLCLWL